MVLAYALYRELSYAADPPRVCAYATCRVAYVICSMSPPFCSGITGNRTIAGDRWEGPRTPRQRSRAALDKAEREA